MAALFILLALCATQRATGDWDETPLRFDTEYFKLLLSCDWRIDVEDPGGPVYRCSDKPGLLMLTRYVAASFITRRASSLQLVTDVNL